MIEKRIDQNFQSLFEKYGYSKDTEQPKSIFEQLNNCDVTKTTKKLNESVNEGAIKDLANKALKVINRGKNYEVINSNGDILDVFDTETEANNFARNYSKWNKNDKFEVQSYDRAAEKKATDNWVKQNLDYEKASPINPNAGSSMYDLKADQQYEDETERFENNRPQRAPIKKAAGKAFRRGGEVLNRDERNELFHAQPKNEDLNESMFGGSPLTKEQLVKKMGGDVDNTANDYDLTATYESLLEEGNNDFSLERADFIVLTGKAGSGNVAKAKQALEQAGVEFEIARYQDIIK